MMPEGGPQARRAVRSTNHPMNGMCLLSATKLTYEYGVQSMPTVGRGPEWIGVEWIGFLIQYTEPGRSWMHNQPVPSNLTLLL